MRANGSHAVTRSRGGMCCQPFVSSIASFATRATLYDTYSTIVRGLLSFVVTHIQESQHSITTFRSSHARFPCTSHSRNTHTLRLQHVFQKRQSVQEKESLLRGYFIGPCYYIYTLFHFLPVPHRTARRTRTWRRTS